MGTFTEDASNSVISQSADVIERMIENEYIQENEVVSQNLSAALERLLDKTFRLAVVGEFSSGKSTFLNALLGKDILIHGRMETTATITEIVNDTEREGVDIIFADGHEEHSDNLEDIEQYTSTTSTSHLVADEITKVSLHSNIIQAEYPVVLIDTPGLNGIAERHREKTVDIIQKSHACIYLLNVRGASKSDIEFIRFLAKYQKDFIFVQNFIDELEEKEGDTPETKLAKQKELLEEALAGDELSFTLCAISSLWALEAKLRTPMDTKRYEASRFADVEARIQELMVKNQKECLQQKAAMNTVISYLGDQVRLMELQKQQVEAYWLDSLDGKAKEAYEKALERSAAYRKKYEEMVDNFVIAESEKIRRNAEQLLEDEMDVATSQINDGIERYKTSDDLEADLNGRKWENQVNRYVAEVENRLRQEMETRFSNLYDDTISEIEKYSADMLKDLRTLAAKDFAQGASNMAAPNFDAGETELQRIRKNQAEEEQRIQRYADRKREKWTEQQRQQFALNETRQRISSENQHYYARRSCLGSRPVAQAIKKTRTIYRKRTGFFSIITNPLFGDKEDTETYTEYDDSAGRRYDAQMRDIENEHSSRIIKLNYEESRLRDRLRETQREIEQCEKEENASRVQMKRLEERYQIKLEENQKAQQLARKNYLESQKRELRRKINQYSVATKDSLKEQISDAKKSCQEKIREEAKKFYNKAMDEQEKSLRSKVEEKSDANKADKIGEAIEEILNAVAKLEGYVCQI